MTSIRKRAGAACLATCVAGATIVLMGAGSSAGEDASPSWSRGLQGTWRVQVTPLDCTSGTPLPVPSFAALLTFAEGGTLTGTTSNPAFKPGQRTPDHGVWRRTGWRRYQAVSEAFVLFDSPPPPLPLQRGVQRITQRIEVEDDQFVSGATVEYFDTAGHVVGTGCASAAGSRFE